MRGFMEALRVWSSSSKATCGSCVRIYGKLYRIAYEALWHACRHACASLISLTVSYGERELLILIVDIGCGIAPVIRQSEAADRHIFLTCMRERAGAIRARLHIESREGAGTRVEIRIDSR